MKLCVVGLGYIGLPTSAMFAKYNADVVGVDVSAEVIDKLNRGEIHIEEYGLANIIKKVVKNGKFRATLTPEKADAFIVAVPTPNIADEYRSCDLTYVLNAIKVILPFAEKGNVIIVESTVAPRTMDDYVRPLIEKAGFTIGEDIFLSHCPERVLPGKILHELIHNNRIIGGVTPACAEASAEIYRLFVEGEIVLTTARTAEMSKLMENTFRDVNIALVNELTKICNDLEVNVIDVIQMANKHPRVNLHQPGPGVGGHCLAVDPHFIYSKSPDLAKIIKLSRETNDSMPQYVADSVKKLVKDVENPKIAAFGVTYKGNVDDMRESPAMEVVQKLLEAGFEVVLHDPYATSDEYEFVSAEESVTGADLVIILADHDEFKRLDYNSLAEKMRKSVLFDTRNCVQPDVVACNKMKIINFGNLHQFITSS